MSKTLISIYLEADQIALLQRAVDSGIGESRSHIIRALIDSLETSLKDESPNRGPHLVDNQEGPEGSAVIKQPASLGTGAKSMGVGDKLEVGPAIMVLDGIEYPMEMQGRLIQNVIHIGEAAKKSNASTNIIDLDD